VVCRPVEERGQLLGLENDPDVLLGSRALVARSAERNDELGAITPLDERHDTVGPEMIVDRHTVEAEVAEDLIGIGRGGMGDVAALPITVHDHPRVTRMAIADDAPKRSLAGFPVSAEEGDIGLDGTSEVGYGIGNLLAEVEDRLLDVQDAERCVDLDVLRQLLELLRRINAGTEQLPESESCRQYLRCNADCSHDRSP